MVASQRILLIIVTIIFSVETIVDGSRQSCPEPAIVDLTAVTPDASGFVNKSGVVFPRPLIKFEDDGFFGCLCDIKVCVPLCCPEGYALNVEGCVNDKFTPDHSHTQEGWIHSWNNHMFVDNPCEDPLLFTVPQMSHFEWLDDGAIYLPNKEKRVELGSYCVFRKPNSSHHNHTLTCPNFWELIDLSTCFIVCTIISIFFMLATFVAYCVMPRLKNLQGRILRSFLFSYICGMIVFAAFVLQSEDSDDINHSIPGSMSLYFGLACLLWSNVMSFDSWRNFRELRSNQDVNYEENQKQLFAWYSIYSWGASAEPLINCIINRTWPKATSYESIQSYVGTGLRIVPIVIIICNSCFYISTASRITQYEKKTALTVKGMDKCDQKNKEWFHLYLKLFIIMVCHLILWVVSIEWDHHAYRVFVIILEALKGASVFIMFVWREDVKRSFRELFLKILLWLRFFLPQTAVAVTADI